MRIAHLNRRHFMARSPLFLAAFTFTACTRSAARSSQGELNQPPQNQNSKQAQPLPPTPACPEYGPTPSQTEGPFYSPNSPQRQSLLTAEVTGTRLVVTGQVLTVDCVPLADCLIDVWQANAQGSYDNTGNTLRGHQFTDAEGRYWLETIVPGVYPGRTRHLHVKVQAPDYSVLTTQLYLPDEPLNEKDFLFQPALLMKVQETAEATQAQFDFVLAGKEV